jgi:arsenite-transporting ATPase
VAAPLPSAEVFAEADRLFYKTLHRLRARLLSARTSVRIVVTPESMVIDEARRSLTDLCLFQLASDAVVFNRKLPEEALRETFFRDWGRAQRDRLREVEETFAPLACLVAPLQADEVRGLEALVEHGRMLFGERDPAAVLGRSLRMRFESDAEGARVRLPLPGLDPATLEVVRIEDELVIAATGRRRKIALPVGFAKLEITRVAYREGQLEISFAPLVGVRRTDSIPKRPASASPPAA